MIKVREITVTKPRAHNVTVVTKPKVGRPKRYETSGEKQKAYRERVKAKTDAEWLAETVGADG